MTRSRITILVVGAAIASAVFLLSVDQAQAGTRFSISVGVVVDGYRGGIPTAAYRPYRNYASAVVQPYRRYRSHGNFIVQPYRRYQGYGNFAVLPNRQLACYQQRGYLPARDIAPRRRYADGGRWNRGRGRRRGDHGRSRRRRRR